RLTMRELLENGETPLLEGFLSANGQGYSGILKLNEKGELQLVSEDGTPVGGSVAEITEDSQPICACPFGSDRKIFETETTFQCNCDESCKDEYPKIKKVAILPKIVCKREMSPEEAKKFFEEGITEEIDDFISRYGRPFKAKLKLKDNGKHGFEFAPREPKKKKAKDATAKTKSKKKSKAKRKSAKGKKKASTKAKKSKVKAKKTKKKKAGASK
ncbi:MAG: topoisomerase C-terminal repeat-containing protein, partial [Candidatus Eremiobacteraeota bacterium]|nr:topoisomerase C-terminal repeat-containing protein [Candidatus Eremiobacteraeota bacterium]